MFQLQNKADRMGPGGSRRPRNSQHATASTPSASSCKEQQKDVEHEFDIIAYKTTFWRTVSLLKTVIVNYVGRCQLKIQL